jgi:hypothetical protein
MWLIFKIDGDDHTYAIEFSGEETVLDVQNLFVRRYGLRPDDCRFSKNGEPLDDNRRTGELPNLTRIDIRKISSAGYTSVSRSNTEQLMGQQPPVRPGPPAKSYTSTTLSGPGRTLLNPP